MLAVGLDKRCFVKCVPIRNSSFRCTDQCQALGAVFSVEFRAPPSQLRGRAFHALRTMQGRQVIARLSRRKLPYDGPRLTHKAISYGAACWEPLGHILAASSKAWESWVFRWRSLCPLGRDGLLGKVYFGLSLTLRLSKSPDWWRRRIFPGTLLPINRQASLTIRISKHP